MISMPNSAAVLVRAATSGGSVAESGNVVTVPGGDGLVTLHASKPDPAGDHVKSLFEKLGVAGRQELVARVFLHEYLPEVIRQTPLTSHGRFQVD